MEKGERTRRKDRRGQEGNAEEKEGGKGGGRAGEGEGLMGTFLGLGMRNVRRS